MSLLICFQRLYSCLVFLEFLLSIIIGVNPVLEAVPWFPDQYFSFLSLCYLHFLSYHFWFWKSNTETNSPCLNVAHTYTFFFFFQNFTDAHSLVVFICYLPPWKNILATCLLWHPESFLAFCATCSSYLNIFEFEYYDFPFVLPHELISIHYVKGEK